MVAHPVAVASDVDDVTVMDEAVDESGGPDFVAENSTPLLEPFVGGQDRGGALVATVDELEEEHSPALTDGQVADLVHYQERGIGQGLEAMGQAAGCLGFLERRDEVDERSVVHPPATLGRSDSEADGEVCLPDAGWPEEHHVLLTLQEPEFMKAIDLFALDGRLEREVEVFQSFDNGKPRRPHGSLEPAVVTERDLSSEEVLDGLGSRGGSTVHGSQDLVQGLQGAGHLKVGELGSDAVSPTPGCGLHRPSPANWAYTWRGRRSTVMRGTEGRRERLALGSGGLRTRERYGREAKGSSSACSCWNRSKGRSLRVPCSRTLATVSSQWFVDLLHLPSGQLMQDGRHPMAHVFDDLRARSCLATPVTGLARGAAYQESTIEIHTEDRRGVCLRLTLSEAAGADLEENLETLLDLLGVKSDQCDLVLDLGAPNFHPVEGFAKLVLGLLRRIPDRDQWRTLTTIGTSFPSTMGEIRKSPSLLDRSEWLLYKEIAARAAGTNSRIPTFGDYGINHKEVPRLDMRTVKPSGTIRYTIEDAWFIVKGPNVRDHGFGQYRGHCKTVISSPYFMAQSSSWGDTYIQECADGKATTGNLSTWRKIGTNRHLEVVVQEIATLFGP